LIGSCGTNFKSFFRNNWPDLFLLTQYSKLPTKLKDLRFCPDYIAFEPFPDFFCPLAFEKSVFPFLISSSLISNIIFVLQSIPPSPFKGALGRNQFIKSLSKKSLFFY